MVSGLYLSETDRTVSAQRLPSPDAVNATGTAQTATAETDQTNQTNRTNQTDTAATGAGATETDSVETSDGATTAQAGDRHEPVHPTAAAPRGGVA